MDRFKFLNDCRHSVMTQPIRASHSICIFFSIAIMFSIAPFTTRWTIMRNILRKFEPKWMRVTSRDSRHVVLPIYAKNRNKGSIVKSRTLVVINYKSYIYTPVYSTVY